MEDGLLVSRVRIWTEVVNLEVWQLGIQISIMRSLQPAFPISMRSSRCTIFSKSLLWVSWFCLHEMCDFSLLMHSMTVITSLSHVTCHSSNLTVTTNPHMTQQCKNCSLLVQIMFCITILQSRWSIRSILWPTATSIVWQFENIKFKQKQVIFNISQLFQSTFAIQLQSWMIY